MQRVHAFLGFTFLAISAGVVACGGNALSPQACTDIGCSTEGVSVVQFSFAQAGTYRFELTVDGKAVRCTASLPLRGGPGDCDDPRVTLGQSGSELPDDQQSIGPLYVRGDDTKRIEVQATRDDVEVGAAAFDVEHTETPGPNGPGCEPEVCRAASGGALK